MCFLLKDINTQYHHFMYYTYSLLIVLLVPVCNSLSTSQRESPKTEIEPCGFNGCYCPLPVAPSPYCFLQWPACSAPIFSLSLLLKSPVVPLLLGSHTCCSQTGRSSHDFLILTPSHMSFITLDLISSINDIW